MGLFDFVGDILTGGAVSAGKAAKQQNKLSKEQLENEEYWRNLMWQYQQPLAQSAVNTNAALQPVYRQMAGQLGYLYGMQPGTQTALPQLPTSLPRPEGGDDQSFWDRLFGALSGNSDYVTTTAPMQAAQSVTVPTADQLPSWMQVPDVDEIIGKLKAGNEADLARLQLDLTSRTRSAMQGRGLGGNTVSTTGAAMANNVPLWMMQERAKQNAGLATTGYGMNMQNNTYLQNLASNMANQLAGYQAQMQPNIDMTSYANAASQNAANAQNMANLYNQQAGQGYGAIGNIIGDWWANSQNRSNAVNAAQLSASYSPNLLLAGGIGNNPFSSMFK